MLSGQPGDGKSAIAKHLIVKKSRQGYRFVLINGSNDFDSVNFDEKLILFFDDIFGVTVYDRSRTEDVQRILWQLDSHSDEQIWRRFNDHDVTFTYSSRCTEGFEER